MIENKRFFKSGIMLTLVGLAIKTGGMLFGAYISRTVGAEGTGLYTLVMTVYSFALTLATSGISLTVTAKVAAAIGESRGDRLGDLLFGAFVYSLGFGVIATIALFFGADFVGQYLLSDVRAIIPLKILSFSLIPVALSAMFSGYFIGVKRVSFNAVSSVVCQIARIIITVAVVGYFASEGVEKSVLGLCLSITLTELLGLLVVFLEFIYDRIKTAEKRIKRENFTSEISKMALPIAFSAYVRSILLNIEHILIPRKLREHGESSSEAYANYGELHGMALPLITYPMSPLSSFAGLLVPEFAEDLSAGRRERLSRVAEKALNATLAYAIICSVMLSAFSEELGYIIYNSYDAGRYIYVLSMVVPIMYLDHVTDSMLKGMGEQVFSMWVNITDSFLSVLLVCLLIPRIGIMGYALVIVIMEGYNFLLSFYRLKRRVDFSLKWSSFLLPLGISLLSSRITKWLFRFSGKGTPAIWIILKIIFSISVMLFVYEIISINQTRIKQKIKKNKQRKTTVN